MTINFSAILKFAKSIIDKNERIPTIRGGYYFVSPSGDDQIDKVNAALIYIGDSMRCTLKVPEDNRSYRSDAIAYYTELVATVVRHGGLESDVLRRTVNNELGALMAGIWATPFMKPAERLEELHGLRLVWETLDAEGFAVRDEKTSPYDKPFLKCERLEERPDRPGSNIVSADALHARRIQKALG